MNIPTQPAIGPNRPLPRTAIWGEVYARAGEAVYCEKGHPLARFGRDVIAGHDHADGDLIAIAPIKPGDTACPECGGYVVAALGIYYFDSLADHPEKPEGGQDR